MRHGATSNSASTVSVVGKVEATSGPRLIRYTKAAQREASGRPDVLVFTTDALTEPVKISGEPIANLVASTSGTDADWVVKLIDVYPDQVAGQPAMGGYQLMVSAVGFGLIKRELEVSAGETPLLEIYLSPGTAIVDEMTVTAEIRATPARLSAAEINNLVCGKSVNYWLNG